jgi:hypothetical protein
MKRILILSCALLAFAFGGMEAASARVVVGATVGIPLAPSYYASRGYYSSGCYPAPVYNYGYRYHPAPVVVYPPPVVYRSPVYVGAPVVNFGFSFGGGYYHGYSPYRHYRGCW